MAVDTSRAPMDFPSKPWENRTHMIESLANLEGKSGDQFYLGKGLLPKRNLYMDVDSPTSVVNALASPYGVQGSSSPAADEAPQGPRQEHHSPLPVESEGQQLGAQMFTQAVNPSGRGTPGRGTQANGTNQNGANQNGTNQGYDSGSAAGGEGSNNRTSSSQGGGAGGDRNNDGNGRREGRDGVHGTAEQADLARQRELAFEGNQQQEPGAKAPPPKQDFFTKIKLAMCAAPQTIESDMEEDREFRIGWPTNVKHLVHVSFDRFRGFVGLPEEMGEDQKNAPGASLSVFGVNPESLQVSWDSRHTHCVPTVLCQLQERLVAENGLKVEGVFRIAAESEEEEYIRGKLNKGEDPPDTEVHVLAGLIKAWFRELPSGVLDALTPEQVAAAQKESEVVALVAQLPETNRALLDWAVDLMADVVERQSFNKMNARNIAMVFAPNMTQVMDPLKALMHAVKVMNLLKVLIEKRLRERRQAAADEAARMQREMLRLAEEEEARARAEEEQLEREMREREEHEATVLAEREAAMHVSALAGEGSGETKPPVHAAEKTEARDLSDVNGATSWQSLAASMAALLTGGDASADQADGEDSDSGDEFFEVSDSIRSSSGTSVSNSDVRAPVGQEEEATLPATPRAVDASSLVTDVSEGPNMTRSDVARGDDVAERHASRSQVDGTADDVARPETEAKAPFEGEQGRSPGVDEKMEQKSDDVAGDDVALAEAMRLPVSRSELLVLVEELERKDELVPVIEEEHSEGLAVVREKVDIELEHERSVEEGLSPKAKIHQGEKESLVVGTHQDESVLAAKPLQDGAAVKHHLHDEVRNDDESHPETAEVHNAGTFLQHL